jgi:hypothetical protein
VLLANGCHQQQIPNEATATYDPNGGFPCSMMHAAAVERYGKIVTSAMMGVEGFNN